MLKSFATILLLTLGLTANATAQTNETSTSQDQYLIIYVHKHDAENLEKDGDLKAALATYLDCQKRLIALSKVDPDLSIALPHLSDEIEKLKTKIAESSQNSPTDSH